MYTPRFGRVQALRKSTELVNSADPPNNSNSSGVESVIGDGWNRMQRHQGSSPGMSCIPECTRLDRQDKGINGYPSLDIGCRQRIVIESPISNASDR